MLWFRYWFGVSSSFDFDLVLGLVWCSFLVWVLVWDFLCFGLDFDLVSVLLLIWF